MKNLLFISAVSTILGSAVLFTTLVDKHSNLKNTMLLENVEALTEVDLFNGACDGPPIYETVGLAEEATEEIRHLNDSTDIFIVYTYKACVAHGFGKLSGTNRLQEAPQIISETEVECKNNHKLPTFI